MEKKNDTVKELLSLLKVFVISFACFWLITKFLFNPVIVDGISMYPTLHDKDRGLSNMVGLNFGVERYDIVVVNSKDNDTEHWVKRIIGMPGDTLRGEDGVVYVNDEPIDESYLDADYIADKTAEYGHFNRDFDEITLADDEYFLLGDNRPESKDSSLVGPFKEADLISKGVLIFWPLNQIGLY
ncbi:signal peptidase I [Dielma fastidiosa]|uniref:signal peptidase I n=1 Tax=Dielma fastidiosa TaxID=1034346 RepID=UPI0035668CA6